MRGCSFSSPWRHRPSHHRGGDRGEVPGGAGGGGGFRRVRGRGPDGGVSADGGGGAQPGAHAAVGEGAGAALRLLLALKRPVALQAPPLQEVGEHLTFALHADLPAADEAVVVRDEPVNVLGHLGKKRQQD